jgi:DNA modification methylase
VDFNLKDLGLSHISNGSLQGRHAWYPIKEAFDPRIVRFALRDTPVRSGGVIVDPFSGSGTVVTEGAASGLRAIGFEVNPFLAFVASAKTINLDDDSLVELRSSSGHLGRRRCLSDLNAFSTFGPGCGRDKWLFNESVLNAVAGIKGGIERSVPLIQPVLLLALLRSAMECCNAVRDGKCLRYRKNWRQAKFSGEILEGRFEGWVSKMASDLVAQPRLLGSARIIHGDSRSEILNLSTEVDLVVTSPPYLNSFDYTDIYRPELFLGGFLDSADSLRCLRSETLRSHVQYKWPAPRSDGFPASLERVLLRIERGEAELWDRRIPDMIRAYFQDMSKVIGDLYAATSKGGRLWIVVATSAYSGIEVPVDDVLIDIAQEQGWCWERTYLLRRIRAASHHFSKSGETSATPLREVAIVLHKRR